jgi:hypothetical protein
MGATIADTVWDFVVTQKLFPHAKFSNWDHALYAIPIVHSGLLVAVYVYIIAKDPILVNHKK